MGRHIIKNQNMEVLTIRRLPDVISTFFLVIFLLVCSVPKGESQLGPPPTLHIGNREWKIPEDFSVGSLFRHAQAMSFGGNEDLVFALQPSEYNDLSSYFKIDSKTGGVTLAKSLKGKRGTQGYMYISVRTVSPDDDTPSIPTKLEVKIQIDPPLSGAGSGHNHTTTRPTFLNVPPFGTQFFPPQLPSSSVPQGTRGRPTIVPPFVENNSQNSTEEPENSTSTGETPVNTQATTTAIPLTPAPAGPNKTNKNDEVTSTTSPVLHSSSSDGGDPLKNSTRYPEPQDNTIDNATVASGKNGSHSDKNKVDNSHTVTLVTIIPIVIVFGVVPIVLATLWLLKKRSKVQKRPTKEIRKESAATSVSNVTSGEGESPSALTHRHGLRAQSNRYEHWDPNTVSPQVQNRWEFPRHHLQIGGILGEGCFGQVWRCEALNIDGKEGTSTVAVKTLKESAGERERADLLSELAVMKMLDRHPNVVRLLGSCTEKDPIFLIMEYVALGKLQTYLRSSRAQHYYGNLHGDSSSLSSKDLTSFAHQVARGMEYLASKGIIHRDLAARNVLIDKDRVCKVADFGFARDVVVNHVYERKSDGRLPIRWMAPEALYDNIFTTKTDVWSFGVLMWEIVTLGSTPYPGMAAGEVMRKVRDGYRLEKPEHCRRELYNIMFYCWAHNPDDRPSFSELVNFLKHLLFSETDYIELDRFPDHDYYNMTSLSGEKL